jgi:uncharacterized membrane protein YfcA
MTIALGFFFFLTAALYASVGFGGGSTYNALLVLHGTDYRILPGIALVCNILVVAGGVIRFHLAKQLGVRRLLPFLVTSIPAAWLGGRLPISETVFVNLLGAALLVSGLYLAFERPREALPEPGAPSPAGPTPYLIGGGIGLLSGLVGIGGGIFLAPVLYFMKWGTPRQIAAASSFFILLNSISGLTGQMMKLQDTDILHLAAPYWILFPLVVAGGQIGSWMASQKLQPQLVKRLTAILLLYVAARLLYDGVSRLLT